MLERNKKLVNLLDTIGDLPLGSFSDSTIDLFGGAYEYLMGMYASAGVLHAARGLRASGAHITIVGKTEVNKVYDPACGSGSLLLKYAKLLPNGVRQGFFGQEINLTTDNQCRINMFLHNINYEKFDIALGDTLTDPKHWDNEPFEAIVSNPLLINDPRISPAGVLAPKSKNERPGSAVGPAD